MKKDEIERSKNKKHTTTKRTKIICVISVLFFLIVDFYDFCFFLRLTDSFRLEAGPAAAWANAGASCTVRGGSCTLTRGQNSSNQFKTGRTMHT